MPRIQPTPEPYSSTLISLSPEEQFRTTTHPFRAVLSVLVFPPTEAPDAAPACFQLQTEVSTSPVYTAQDVPSRLPATLQGLVSQILQDYTDNGPVPAIPDLSPEARSGFSGLGRRAGKGRWI